ncbi:MAG: Vgb family protein [Chromatiales bacterium]
MKRVGVLNIAVLALTATAGALAGGSNYGVVPGGRDITGAIREWPVPTPKFARDPAPGPDGRIYIAVMQGNKIARFEPQTGQFTEWELPKGAQPHGLVVDSDGIIWYTGNGNGTIGELDPRTGKVIDHQVPKGGDPHTAVFGPDGTIWFTVQAGNRIGHLNRLTGEITVYETSGRPYGIAIDHQGYVWFCRIGGDMLGRLDPATATITDLPLESGSQPRRMAIAPDGTLWVTLYGSGKLLHVDPVKQAVIKAYPMPAGEDGGPYAVTVDARGRVWTNEIKTDTVALFDPATEKFRVFELPSQGVGIRKAIVDADGRYWYMGSHNGRLGVIE